MKITLLGTGTSHGVPMIGCDCEVCCSSDPHDQRMRTSAVISFDGRSILIDTSPELRLQALRFNVRQVDAIFYTHAHADHIAGLDDVRRWNWMQQQIISAYGNLDTIQRLKKMFGYAQADPDNLLLFRPCLDFEVVDGPFELFGKQVIPIELMHGVEAILGYRLDSFAYCTDVSAIPELSWPLLEGVEVLVLDALRHREHPTHFSVPEALAAASRIGARQTYLTHIAHDLAHAATNASLPPEVQLAYDGLVIEC